MKNCFKIISIIILIILFGVSISYNVYLGFLKEKNSGSVTCTKKECEKCEECKCKECSYANEEEEKSKIKEDIRNLSVENEKSIVNLERIKKGEYQSYYYISEGDRDNYSKSYIAIENGVPIMMVNNKSIASNVSNVEKIYFIIFSEYIKKCLFLTKSGEAYYIDNLYDYNTNDVEAGLDVKAFKNPVKLDIEDKIKDVKLFNTGIGSDDTAYNYILLDSINKTNEYEFYVLYFNW